MYSHIVEISEPDRRLIIHRVYADGRKELFTEMILPNEVGEKGAVELQEFCYMLGENLLIDSPIARKLLGL